MRSGTSANSWRKVSVTLTASFAILSAMSLSAQGALYHMVDAQNLTGDMSVLTASSTYSGGQWNFTLLVANTGSHTYNDVNLMFQFAWDTATNPQSALTYTNSNSWGGVVNSTTDSFSFGGYGIGPSSSATTPLVAFPWTIANTPLSQGSPSGSPPQNTATISSTDSVPTVPLGNFGPGASEIVKLACPSNPFVVEPAGFFVAAPEPSSISLLVVSGMGLLGYVWRRRLRR